MALRIRPLKNEEKSRGYRCVAEKVDDRVRIKNCWRFSHMKMLRKQIEKLRGTVVCIVKNRKYFGCKEVSQGFFDTFDGAIGQT